MKLQGYWSLGAVVNMRRQVVGVGKLYHLHAMGGRLLSGNRGKKRIDFVRNRRCNVVGRANEAGTGVGGTILVDMERDIQPGFGFR
jgi:hypothetical protein